MTYKWDFTTTRKLIDKVKVNPLSSCYVKDNEDYRVSIDSYVDYIDAKILRTASTTCVLYR